MESQHTHPAAQAGKHSSRTSWFIDNAGTIVPVLGLCIAGVYALTFWDLPFTESPTQWGAFGSYIGGVLGPLVSIFTLVVAVKVWNTQKEELAATRTALEHSSDLMAEQLRSMEASRHTHIVDSCLADLRSAISLVRPNFFSDETKSDQDAVTAASKRLELSQPLIGMNSRAITWILTNQTSEPKPEFEPWDWSITYGNEARELLRLMLPMCRNIGQALQMVASMPEDSQAFQFSRIRNALSESMLSTFTYFLVLHPDGHSLHNVAAQANVLRHLKFQRAQCFAQAYLPRAVWSAPSC